MSNSKKFSKILLPLTMGLLLAFAVAFLASHSLSAMEPASAQGVQNIRAQAAAPVFKADDTIDIGPVIRNKEFPLSQASAERLERQRAELEARGALRADYNVGDTRVFLGLDSYMGFFFFTTYEVRLISDTVEIWVQSDLSYESPVHPDRDDPQHVTQARVEYIAQEFESVIRPTNVDFFGAYDDHTGANAALPALAGLPADYYETTNGQRTIMLVHNVRDGNYYDPANNPSYIAGFYSPTFEFYADRNIITIDSKQWDQRTGPGVERPFLYESVTVHEMQHLVNGDYDSDEDSWANEGRSEFSEFIAGYRPDAESHRSTWSDYPENSLTIWGDQDGDPDQTFEILADYQTAYWFFLYLTGWLADDAGAGLSVDEAVARVAETTQDPANGIASIDGLLDDVGASFDFVDVWEDFRTDMMYGGNSDATAWGDYVTSYGTTSGLSNASLDLGRMRRNLNFEGYDTPGAPGNGSDYLEIGWSPDIAANPTVSLTADIAIPIDWEPVAAISPTNGVSGNVLYSGHTDLNDNFVIFETSVPGSGDQTLSFDTLFDIEAEWDYGFVQVTTDTVGATGWTSLDLTGTMTETNISAHPVIKANVPGYSGNSGGWFHVDHDLSAYAGEDILLAFRYATDWGSAGQEGDVPPGWYLDNVSVGGTDLFTETLPADAMSIWQARGNQYAMNVDFVTFADGNGDAIDQVYSMTFGAEVNGDIFGTFDLSELLNDAGFNGPDERAVAIVSGVLPYPDADLVAAPSGYVSYTLEGLPASINTSRIRAVGTAAGSSLLRPEVYPGDNISLTVTVDNFGRNDDLGTVADSPAFVAVPVPANTTVANSGDFTFASDLSTVDAALPAVPGVYWTGTVADYEDLTFSVQADIPLEIGTEISATAHIANDTSIGAASQYFTEDTKDVEVTSPLAFSKASGPSETVPAGGVASFEYTLVNTDDATREVDFHFTVPAGTSLHGIRFGSTSLSAESVTEATSDEVLLTLDVPSFPETGRAMVVTVDLIVDADYGNGTLSLAPSLFQPDSAVLYHEFEAAEATAQVFGEVVFLPFVAKP